MKKDYNSIKKYLRNKELKEIDLTPAEQKFYQIYLECESKSYDNLLKLTEYTSVNSIKALCTQIRKKGKEVIMY